MIYLGPLTRRSELESRIGLKPLERRDVKATVYAQRINKDLENDAREADPAPAGEWPTYERRRGDRRKNARERLVIDTRDGRDRRKSHRVPIDIVV